MLLAEIRANTKTEEEFAAKADNKLKKSQLIAACYSFHNVIQHFRADVGKMIAEAVAAATAAATEEATTANRTAARQGSGVDFATQTPLQGKGKDEAPVPRLDLEEVCPSIKERDPNLCPQAQGLPCDLKHPVECSRVECEPFRQKGCLNWHLRCKLSELEVRRQEVAKKKADAKEERRRQDARAREITKAIEDSKYGRALQSLVNSPRGPKSAGPQLNKPGGKKGKPAPEAPHSQSSKSKPKPKSKGKGGSTDAAQDNQRKAGKKNAMTKGKGNTDMGQLSEKIAKIEADMGEMRTLLKGLIASKA